MSFPFSLPLLLDGATGTNLIRAGMPAGVCVEEWILSHPETVLSVQRAFIEAGSQAILAPTFGANRSKLSHYGLENKTAEINAHLVALSKKAAAGTNVLIGGDLSPTGLMPEPYGTASFEEICEIYREQVQALKLAGVDFIAAETQMSLADLRAAVFSAAEAKLPVFASITVEESGRTVMGADLLSILITLEAIGVAAVGLNCSTGPAAMKGIIERVLPHTSLPLICKPNAGKPCANDPTKYDLSPEAFAAEMKSLLDAGARIVGGCCGTTPEHIAALSKLLKAGNYAPLPEEKPDNFAAAIESQCFFLGDNLLLSEPIECSYDLSEDLIDIEDEDCNTALVVLNTLEDAKILAENAMMARLPIAVHAHDPVVLEAALFGFQGRLLVDSECSLEREELESIAQKYGAIVY